MACFGSLHVTGCGVGPDPKIAHHYVVRSANAKHPRGQVWMGRLHERGFGVKQDYAEALKWYRLAAEQNDPDAFTKLGEYHATGTAVAKNDEQAVKYYAAAAALGDAAGQTGLGELTDTGRGVSRNPAEAVRLFRLAADQKYAPGQFQLGWALEHGLGVAPDPAEAAKWYRLAADQDLPDAQYWLGRLYQDGRGVVKKETYAASLYIDAARRGHALAQVALGLAYDRGMGVGKSKREAVKSFQFAAAQGNAEGQYRLGRHLSTGTGVAKDQVEALRWLRAAAEQKHANAKFFTGLAYSRGEGTARNDVEAAKWIRLAADQGQVDGLYFLGRFLETGTGIAKDEKAAVRYYAKAAESKFPLAQLQMGLAHARGTGATKDPAEGAKWFRLAGDQGNVEALYQLGLLYADGNGVAKDEREALRLFRLAESTGHAEAVKRIVPEPALRIVVPAVGGIALDAARIDAFNAAFADPANVERVANREIWAGSVRGLRTRARKTDGLVLIASDRTEILLSKSSLPIVSVYASITDSVGQMFIEWFGGGPVSEDRVAIEGVRDAAGALHVLGISRNGSTDPTWLAVGTVVADGTSFRVKGGSWPESLAYTERLKPFRGQEVAVEIFVPLERDAELRRVVPRSRYREIWKPDLPALAAREVPKALPDLTRELESRSRVRRELPLRTLLPLAIAGDAGAQYAIALVHMRTIESSVLATAWLERAVLGGHRDAQRLLAVLYLANGNGITLEGGRGPKNCYDFRTSTFHLEMADIEKGNALVREWLAKQGRLDLFRTEDPPLRKL